MKTLECMEEPKKNKMPNTREIRVRERDSKNKKKGKKMDEGDCGNKDGRRKRRVRGIREATGWWKEEL